MEFISNRLKTGPNFKHKVKNAGSPLALRFAALGLCADAVVFEGY